MNSERYAVFGIRIYRDGGSPSIEGREFFNTEKEAQQFMVTSCQEHPFYGTQKILLDFGEQGNSQQGRIIKFED